MSLKRLYRVLGRRGRGFLSPLPLLLLFLLSTPLLAKPPSTPRLILILCDALTIDDLQDPKLPHLRKMAEEGAIGLMNCNTLSAKTPLEAWMTLAKGEASRGVPKSVEATMSTQGDAFKGVGEESTLGAVLARANRRVTCFGNSDTLTSQRPAVLFGMDSSGAGSGNLDSVRGENEAPFHHIDDPIALSQSAFGSEAEMVVLNLGDTDRLEASRRELFPSEYPRFREGALRRLNILVALLTQKIRADHLPTSLLLVSAYPPGEPVVITDYWHRLTPIVGWGNLFPQGLFFSRTTRTLGLLANVDVAPTILNLLKAPLPPNREGRPMKVVGSPENAESRLAMLARKDYLCTLNFQALTKLTAPLFFFCAGWVVMALIAQQSGSIAFRWLSYGFVFGLSSPLALLLAPLLPPPTLWEYGLRILAWMGGLTLLVAFLSRASRFSPLLLTLGVDLIGIALDTLTGQNLMKESMVTNAALVGVRYYGVGNEYLGMIVGFALVGGFAWLEERRLRQGVPQPDIRGRRGLVIFWTLCTLLLGSPLWGANAGSLILCVMGFGSATLLLWGKPLRWQNLCLLLVLGIGITVALSALEARFAREEASHLGASLQAAMGGRGVGYLGEIVLRKARLNLLTLFSRWYFLSIFCVSLMFWGAWRVQREAFAKMTRHYVGLEQSLRPLFTIGVTALLFKDTGAMTVLFLGSSAYAILLWYTTQPPD